MVPKENFMLHIQSLVSFLGEPLCILDKYWKKLDNDLITLVGLQKKINIMNENFSGYAAEWVSVLSIKLEIRWSIESSFSSSFSFLSYGESLKASFLFF